MLDTATPGGSKAASFGAENIATVLALAGKVIAAVVKASPPTAYAAQLNSAE